MLRKGQMVEERFDKNSLGRKIIWPDGFRVEYSLYRLVE